PSVEGPPIVAGRALSPSTQPPPRRADPDPPPTPAPAPAPAPRGALSELVTLWSGGQPPGINPMPAPASRSTALVPTTAAMAPLTPAQQADQATGPVLSLDELSDALEELLRREAERHGLDGTSM